MTLQVDFYLLKYQQDESYLSFICHLISKIYQQQYTIKVDCENPVLQQKLDNLLWSFTEESFIPHTSYTTKTPSLQSWVLISKKNTIPENISLQINLQLSPLPSQSTWQRLLQIVPDHPGSREIARQHYRFYQKQNYKLASHEINR